MERVVIRFPHKAKLHKKPQNLLHASIKYLRRPCSLCHILHTHTHTSESLAKPACDLLFLCRRVCVQVQSEFILESERESFIEQVREVIENADERGLERDANSKVNTTRFLEVESCTLFSTS